MKQKAVLAIIMIILSMSFVSCSYKEFEDSLRNPKQEVSEEEAEQYTNQASIVDTDEITNEETENQKHRGKGHRQPHGYRHCLYCSGSRHLLRHRSAGQQTQ